MEKFRSSNNDTSSLSGTGAELVEAGTVRMASASRARPRHGHNDVSRKMSIPVDPIYGEDAAQRYIADHFDRANPFGLSPVVDKRARHNNAGEAAQTSMHGEPETALIKDADQGVDKKPEKLLGKPSSEKAEQSEKPEKPEKPEKANKSAKDLTIFINLAANRGLLNSSLREDEEIRKLEKLTKGKSINLVVQVAMSQDQSLNHLKATKADLVINELGALEPDKQHTEVVRYEISDGTKRLLGSGHSRGLTEDLSDLLQADPEAMKAKRLMLFDRSHGMAMHGLRGDAGNTSIAELKPTLGTALSRAGRESFDVIDADACLMGNAQSLVELAPVAKFMIASEVPEVSVAKTAEPIGKSNRIKSGANAQPLAAAVRKLIGNTKLEAHDAALEIAATNKTECAKVSKDGLCGANTLGVYDLSRATEFSQSLDRFGASLMLASPLGENKKVLQAAVSDLPSIVGEPDGLGGTVDRKDLGGLVSAVRSGLDTHTITDTADGALSRAADGLRSSMKDFVVSHFNSFKPSLSSRFKEVGLPPASLDGLSVFIVPRQPIEKQAAFNKHFSDDSTAAQPHWNEFVKATGSAD